MLSAIRHTFKVYERLKKEQHINTLFHKGKAFSVFPLRPVFHITSRDGITGSPCVTGFSVPKKKFSSSVHRHRIRRLMLEAWRLHKHVLYEAVPGNIQIHLFLIYTDKTMPDYNIVEGAVLKAIEHLKKVVSVNGE